jgi:hypothetical protein
MSTISLPERTTAPELVTPVISAYHAPVAAPLESARAALDQLEPLPRLARALQALCPRPGTVQCTSSASLRDERAFSLELWLDGTGIGTVTLTWVVSVAARGTGASSVLVASRIDADRTCVMDRILDAWVVVGPMIEDQTRRIARALVDGAEEDEL